jgi:hypothetical protein
MKQAVPKCPSCGSEVVERGMIGTYSGRFGFYPEKKGIELSEGRRAILCLDCRHVSVTEVPVRPAIPRGPLIVRCPGCGAEIRFDQPYKYHAGFGDQGFLYNEAGDRTLVWNSYDRAYTALVGPKHPWMLDPAERALVEDRLLPAPDGGRWLFANLPRCPSCRGPIGESILKDIYYFDYAGSVHAEKEGGLARCLLPEPTGRV